MGKPRILVVGSFVMDMITTTKVFPASGETVLGMGFSTASGGKGANQAVQAARLGAEVTMIGKVGKDAFGEQMLKSVGGAGVHVDKVLQDENGVSSAIGNITLEVDERGNRHNRIIVVPGANMTTTVDEIAFLKDEVADYDLVMLQFEIPMAVNIAVAQWAKEKGVPVMVNPAPAAAMPDELLACTTYLSPNEHEAAALTGIAIHADEHGVNLKDVEQAACALQAKGVQNVLTTLGENGAAFLDKDGLHDIASVPNVAVADPTAAGDSFVAAFCVGICIGLNACQAMDFARNTAAITVSKSGAQPSLPNIEEVVASLRTHGEKDFPMKLLHAFIG